MMQSDRYLTGSGPALVTAGGSLQANPLWRAREIPITEATLKRIDDSDTRGVGSKCATG